MYLPSAVLPPRPPDKKSPPITSSILSEPIAGERNGDINSIIGPSDANINDSM